MPTSDDKRAALIRKITALFRLAEHKAQPGQQGTSEAEVLAAVTKAKELMIRHAISEAMVQEAIDVDADRQHEPRWTINTHAAYSRKMKNLAYYDEIVSWCVGVLTGTEPLMYRSRGYDGKWYVQLRFVGAEGDVQVAAELFMIFLQALRDRTAGKMGRGKNVWGRLHTSYAIGFAQRMLDRAREEMRSLTREEAATMALVVRTKEDAIAVWKKEQAIGKGKARRISLDGMAHHQGYVDGADFSLSKQVIKK